MLRVEDLQRSQLPAGALGVGGCLCRAVCRRNGTKVAARPPGQVTTGVNSYKGGTKPTVSEQPLQELRRIGLVDTVSLRVTSSAATCLNADTQTQNFNTAAHLTRARPNAMLLPSARSTRTTRSHSHPERLLHFLEDRVVLLADRRRHRRRLFPGLPQMLAQHPAPFLVRLLLLSRVGFFARLLRAGDRRLCRLSNNARGRVGSLRRVLPHLLVFHSEHSRGLLPPFAPSFSCSVDAPFLLDRNIASFIFVCPPRPVPFFTGSEGCNQQGPDFMPTRTSDCEHYDEKWSMLAKSRSPR